LLRALDAAVFLFLLTRVEASSEDDQQPAAEVQRLGSPLYLLAGARIALVVFVVLLDGSEDVWGDGAVAYRVGVVASTAVEMGALIWFGYALIEAARGRSDYPRWLLVAGATAAWCVAGRTLMRVTEFVPRYFQQYFERRDSMRFSGLVGTGSEPLLIPALSAQTLMAIALGSVLVAIAIGAARQANESVRTRTMVALAAFAALSIGALTIQGLITDAADLTPLGTVILIGGNAAVIASVAIVVAVVRRSASGAATLPMARARDGRS
jgi:hypothetical protein